MNGIDKRAWKILNEDEQLALTLKHGHGKSSWEVGEIVGRAHYKFLEIEARAKEFLKMFTEHFQLYDQVIPDFLEIDERVKTYLRHTIEKRRSVSDAVDLVNDETFSITMFRNRIITEAMTKLTQSEDVIDKNIALLIFDFDRWNNFRILPVDIQEPSAFKRRAKNADRRNMKNLINLHTFIVEQIVQRYHKPNLVNNPDVRKIYVPVFSKFVKKENSIMVVRYEDEFVKQFSKMGLYVFAKELRAKQFQELVTSYDFDRPKDCKYGQKFWPMFREISKNSLNYNEVQKRIPSRKFLEEALGNVNIKLPSLDLDDNYQPIPIKIRKKRVRKEKKKD